MPEQTPVPTEGTEAAEPAAAAAKSSLLAKLKILGFVVIVILIECVVAGLYLPSSSETAAMTESALGADSETATHAAQNGPQQETLVDQIEVDLGEFTVTAFQPISNTTLRIDFHLFGTVGTADETEFLKRMEGNLHRFRDQVIATIRSAEMSDFAEPGLGLIKRRILERTNKTLGRPLLRVVMFSDFSFIEQ